MRSRSRHRQRGSIAVLAALWIGIAVLALGATDIGNVFFARRDAQRIADLAALAAVQRMDDACAQPAATATSNAQANGFAVDAGKGDTLTVTCGRWDTTNNPGPSYFAAAGGGVTQLNAVQVTVTKEVPYFFFGPTRHVSATSTAKATNVDTFSIGSTLASLGGTGCPGSSVPSTGSSGLVNALVGALLNASLNLDIASYQALACTNVKIGDLVAAANVGTVNELLQTNVSLSGLVNLMATALTKTSVANVDVQASLSALQAIAAANVSGGTIDIGKQSPSGNGLLDVGLATPQSAADATVNLLDLLMVGAEIAQAGHAVALNATVPLAGFTGTQLQVQIIRPPTIAVGEGGIDPATGTWRTRASTAEVGLYLVVDLGLQDLPVLGSLLALIDTNLDVKLPLYLQAGTGSAWLNSTSCAATAAASTAVISAQPGVANLCIGQPPLDASGLISLSSLSTGNNSCTSPAQIVNATVLGITSVSASLSNVSTQVQGSEEAHTFSGVSNVDSDYWTTDSNALGSALSDALAQLSSAKITGSMTIAGITYPLPSGFISTLLGILTQALSPLLSSLDTVIVPLLQLLGVQVGAATVHQISLTCGVAQTVY